MYKIDFIDNSHVNGTIDFTHDYDALLITMNLVNNAEIDYSAFIENHIEPEDTINDSDNTFNAKILRDPRYMTFLRDLNSAIIDSRPVIVDGIDSYDGAKIKQLELNGGIVATSRHTSDETIDMLLTSHVYEYSTYAFKSVTDEFDIIDIYDMLRMMNQFISIVEIMNGEA